MKAVVAAFNQEKALVGAFSVITKLRMELFEALVPTITLNIPSAGLLTAAPADLHLSTIISGLQFVPTDYQLKVPASSSGTHRAGRILEYFFTDTEEDKEEAGAAVSSDPALYWAKLKRNSSRKKTKKGSLKGSLTANKGIVVFPSYELKITFCHTNFTHDDGNTFPKVQHQRQRVI